MISEQIGSYIDTYVDFFFNGKLCIYFVQRSSLMFIALLFQKCELILIQFFI